MSDKEYYFFRCTTFTFNIKTLDPNKAHGCDNISIKIIFEHSLKKGKFPEIWKKANVVHVQRKKCW